MKEIEAKGCLDAEGLCRSVGGNKTGGPRCPVGSGQVTVAAAHCNRALCRLGEADGARHGDEPKADLPTRLGSTRLSAEVLGLGPVLLQSAHQADCGECVFKPGGPPGTWS